MNKKILAISTLIFCMFFIPTTITAQDYFTNPVILDAIAGDDNVGNKQQASINPVPGSTNIISGYTDGSGKICFTKHFPQERACQGILMRPARLRDCFEPKTIVAAKFPNATILSVALRTQPSDDFPYIDIYIKQ